jgi:hypothetical protein
MQKITVGCNADAVYLWAIAQEMPTSKHEHIKSYDLKRQKKI